MKWKKGKTTKSFAKRMIKVWILGVAFPLMLVGVVILWQVYRTNHQNLDSEIESALDRVSGNMVDLMNSMKSISWLLEADGTVGENLSAYLEGENSAQRGEIMIYLREQIANYEVANPSVANLTYLLVPAGTDLSVKINQYSLARGEMPDSRDFLCKWENMSFYGPAQSQSEAANYLCLSLLRPYRLGGEYGDVYIYVESGYKYLERLLPEDVLGIGMLCLIESSEGKVLYSSDPDLVPDDLYYSTIQKEYLQGEHQYKDYKRSVTGDWKIHLWVPAAGYYHQIYSMALNLGIITLLAFCSCIIFSISQWRKIYEPFVLFENRLRLIANDSNVESEVERMNIQEFDDSFALLDKMKRNILLLLNKAQSEEKKRSEVEIREVLGKINPHFLHNTLDTLKWYAAGKKDREMVRFITALNKLLLYNMSKTKETTLQSELEAVKAYIVLQQLKYDIQFTLDTGKHPEILQADMPRFILQPLVENAILHSGLSQGRIWIEVELLASGKISILIKNDGQPIDPERIREVLIQKNDISRNGIGLQYVARMLENRFGDQFVLRAERTEDGINVVEIRIPFEARQISQGDLGSKGMNV